MKVKATTYLCASFNIQQADFIRNPKYKKNNFFLKDNFLFNDAAKIKFTIFCKKLKINSTNFQKGKTKK